MRPHSSPSVSSLQRVQRDPSALRATEDAAASKRSRAYEAYVKISDVLTNLFPLWTVLFSYIALMSPASFNWFTTEYFTGALAVLMLSMGITLTPQDFIEVLKRPASVGVGLVGCYALMPYLAKLLGTVAGLDKTLAAGLVLVGCINGGQASNLCTYIARGDVALSVLMTTATTIGAIFATPLLCKALLGTSVALDAVGIVKSTMTVVLGPIAVGMMANRFFNKAVKAILPVTPLVGVISTCLLVASSVAQVSQPILDAGIKLQIPIILLHLLGGLFGFFIPKAMGLGEVAARTIAIETAMKSSAFGFLLAKLHFADFAVRVPPAVSVVWMAVTGATLAVVWRFIPVSEDRRQEGLNGLSSEQSPNIPPVLKGELATA
ncbi:unnamed protein product [Vitrella brassicaformis CCMP3155]|uniref:Uncharacterized protein n=2 Tax=Vitrella brassicaformis TaxID=1169539 RepID=A0A0G4GLW4_VITBC|nr:unnamed protein product [Vitrella brassicaformis CCMP3155]|eukprot:CEM31106.1 unnamed protein product [Vitrella brassicaformis CCMP3155]